MWPPLKWIFLAVFAPLGLVLTASLFGYVVVVDDEALTFGYYPFVRRLPFSRIREIHEGAVYPLSIWKTNEFVTVTTEEGRQLSFPCVGAEEIISVVKSRLA